MTGHHHMHAPSTFNRAFAFGVGLNVVYILVEVAFGLYAGSLALLADAGHNLSDVIGLLMAWAAAYLSSLKPTARRTYGWRTSSILAALLNSLFLLVAVGGIVWEAIRRFSSPQPVMGWTVILVAGVGVVINTATALLFLSGRKKDLNIKGAFLHMAADALVSLGVVLAGAIILWTGWLYVDPLMSLVVAIVIFWSTWSVLRESTNLILQAVPEGISPEEVRTFLLSLPGVTGIHDLHIWAMSTTETALSAHIVRPDIENDDAFLNQTVHALQDRFGIEHATIQIERSVNVDSCPQARQASI